ncbi:MAG: HEAT repeat domain-containing protein [Anaerolineales bacterium]|nr:HEAT repeat domain-containing protein [Anaerolineales bacterium]
MNRQLNEMGEDAIPLLVEGLNHSDPMIRRDAARNLAQDSGPEG